MAWQRHSQEVRSSACVVIDGVAPQEKVVARCVRARQLGIEHGMTKAQAEASAAALFRRRETKEEKVAQAFLMELVFRFSPRVETIACFDNNYANAIEPSLILLLDSSGTGALFGSVEDYAQKLHKELQQASFPAGVGSAVHADTAVVLARSTHGVIATDRHSARQCLAGLPIARLDCDAKTLSVLRRWGIRTFGDLAALPETALVSRLGQQGRKLQQLARGESARLLVPDEPEFTLSETAALDTPIELLDSLLFVLSPMLETTLRKAGQYGYAIRSVCLTLELERMGPHAIAVRPATPTQNQEVLLKLLNLELRAHPPGSGIVSVTLDAEPTQPQTAQRGLFQAQFPEPDKLDILLARLRAIAGDEYVGSPQLQNSHGEDTFTLVPFRPCVREDETCTTALHQTVLRMCRPPDEVRVTCWDHQPRVMVWQGVRHLVRSSVGPWDSSGSWWDGGAWNHDLWDVVTGDPPQALRLRHDNVSNKWFVVGVYD